MQFTVVWGDFIIISHKKKKIRQVISKSAKKVISKWGEKTRSELCLTCSNARSDIVIKPTDKGGPVVVSSRPLYIAKSNRQLSDGRFYERIDHDLIKENQHVVKSMITAMISDNQPPPSTKNLIVTWGGPRIWRRGVSYKRPPKAVPRRGSGVWSAGKFFYFRALAFSGAIWSGLIVIRLLHGCYTFLRSV